MSRATANSTNPASPPISNWKWGRVDFANLPSFPQGERELLRQYLEKDHRFRHRLFTVRPQGLIVDNLGLLSGQKPALNGWRNFSALFGPTNILEGGDWFGTLAAAGGCLWGYGRCGAGTFTSAAGIGISTDFVTQDPPVVFTLFFGSYFGDWDSPDNFLRAAPGNDQLHAGQRLGGAAQLVFFTIWPWAKRWASAPASAKTTTPYTRLGSAPGACTPPCWAILRSASIPWSLLPISSPPTTPLAGWI